MNSPSHNTHSLLVGYLLWIFGFTGAHRFYFGKPLTGLLWLCTLGLFGIGWFIDLFLIPGMERSAERRYHEGPLDYTVAWLLLTFLGPLGAHRFYMGKWGTGLMFLLVSLSSLTVVLMFLLFPLLFVVVPLVLVLWAYDFFTLNGQVDAINRGQG